MNTNSSGRRTEPETIALRGVNCSIYLNGYSHSPYPSISACSDCHVMSMPVLNSPTCPGLCDCSVPLIQQVYSSSWYQTEFCACSMHRAWTFFSSPPCPTPCASAMDEACLFPTPHHGLSIMCLCLCHALNLPVTIEGRLRVLWGENVIASLH